MTHAQKRTMRGQLSLSPSQMDHLTMLSPENILQRFG